MKTYTYTVEGTAVQDPGQTWRVEGEREGIIPTLMDVVLLEAFQKLTRGEARYRNLQTCRGPYTITRFEIVEIGK